MLKAAGQAFTGLERKPKETSMSWSTPVVVEVCAGMEVTAYISAVM
ncbi:MAG: pyrroloquinoline quinone precursor peptide PqqA [Hyphomicrobiales bacterium]|nr:pyrroloquinoline quinone precursor peptide PqqA [Hyphomicrobiales bacterium]